ncbi:hypothetical protein Tco_0963689 [Tanacetum coccineum]
MNDFRFKLIAYSDADLVHRCKDNCKITSRGLQFLDAYTTAKLWIQIQPDSDVLSFQEHVEKGTAKIYLVGTEYQLAELFTKALLKERFEYLVHRIVIIMAQQQHATEVHPDELCPPNKRYDLMDANKKVDLEHVQCPPESKILTNIIKNHPLRFSIAASSSVPWIYMAQFWHTLKEDGRHKDKVGMQIPDWMITEEMKHTEHYRMYAEDTAESIAPKRSTVIHFRLPERRSTRLTPLAPVPTIDKADDMILQDTLQIEKMMEGSENVINDSLPPSNDEPKIPSTRLEHISDKESPEVEITNDEEVEITNVVIPFNVIEEEDEITDEVYELKQREKGKIIEESRSTPFPTPIRSPRTHTNLVYSDTEKL